MFSQAFLSALAAASVVTAHGRIDIATGDLGGNGTAFGIKGAVVPVGGPNYLTEVDTTVFWSKDIATDDDIGFIEDGSGNNQLTDLTQTMALSGNTLPQVSSGGTTSGVWHVVTDDGCGPLETLIDETATAKWSTAKSATVNTTMPGNAGECTELDSGDDTKVTYARSLWRRVRRELVKKGLLTARANNVNKNFDFTVQIPEGTSCIGEINGIGGLCLVKISNNNANGPFGGVYVVQMSSSTTARVRRSTRFTA